jgi:hypothetical protein
MSGLAGLAGLGHRIATRREGERSTDVGVLSVVGDVLVFFSHSLYNPANPANPAKCK